MRLNQNLNVSMWIVKEDIFQYFGFCITYSHVPFKISVIAQYISLNHVIEVIIVND